MYAYDLMIQINRRLIGGEILSDSEKAAIANKLLASAVLPEQALQCYGAEPDSKARKPLFFRPPHNNGAKLKTIFGQTPKTHILNNTMYELEILRLLCIFAPENTLVNYMRLQTVDRLKATCFGYYSCSLGECFDSALVVLRFLCIAAPEETAWIKKIIAVYQGHHADKNRVKAVGKYFALCMSELPFKVEVSS
jgi:hypothetical protein